MTEAQREQVVKEALAWVGTPYHHAGRLKGVGVDCAMFPYMVYRACGIIPETEIEAYPRDWHLHRSEEIYLKYINRFASSVIQPWPGDIALFRMGRTLSHGAIVIEYPVVVHSLINVGVVVDNVQTSCMAKRLAGFWRVRE